MPEYATNLVQIILIIVCLIILKWEIYISNKKIQIHQNTILEIVNKTNANNKVFTKRITDLEKNQEKTDTIYQD